MPSSIRAESARGLNLVQVELSDVIALARIGAAYVREKNNFVKRPPTSGELDRFHEEIKLDVGPNYVAHVIRD